MDRVRLNESEWGAHLLTILCRVEPDLKMDADSRNYTHSMPSKEDRQLEVASLVVDCLHRSIKDTASITPVDKRLGRYHAYVDLISGILTSKNTSSLPFGQNADLASNDAALAIAELMLDKGYVPLLTGALSDIDPTYPDVRSLANAVLRPLEILARLGNRISQQKPDETVTPPNNSPNSEHKRITSLMDSIRSPTAIGLADEDQSAIASRPGNGGEGNANFIGDSALGMLAPGRNGNGGRRGGAGSGISDSDFSGSDEDDSDILIESDEEGMDDDDDGSIIDAMEDVDEEPDEFTDSMKKLKSIP
jgi:E3 ubiquitin-protein ligase HUWE1